MKQTYTPEEFLASTIEYFGKDPKVRRCVGAEDSCRYSPANVTNPLVKTQGCAIGRFLKPRVKLLFDNEDHTAIGRVLAKSSNMVMIPEWMQKWILIF